MVVIAVMRVWSWSSVSVAMIYLGFDRFWMVETITEILGAALLTWVHLCLVASVMNEE